MEKTETVNSATQSTPGKLLSDARTQANLAIETVASQLNLSSPVIQDLEADHYPNSSELIFMKGHLRSYGKLLNIPPEKLLEAFHHLGLEAPPVEVPPLPIKSASSNLTFAFLTERFKEIVSMPSEPNSDVSSTKLRIDAHVRKMTAIVGVALLGAIFLIWHFMYKAMAPAEFGFKRKAEVPVAAVPAVDTVPTASTVAPVPAEQAPVSSTETPATASVSAQSLTKMIQPPKPIEVQTKPKSDTDASPPALHMDLGNG
jgi:cytoskeletal protein RodZ